MDRNSRASYIPFKLNPMIEWYDALGTMEDTRAEMEREYWK